MSLFIHVFEYAYKKTEDKKGFSGAVRIIESTAVIFEKVDDDNTSVVVGSILMKLQNQFGYYQNLAQYVI